MEKCYVALGANLGFARYTVCFASLLIKQHPAIYHFERSFLYKTTPVSAIPQPHYINAACCFYTSLDPETLLDTLQAIEKKLGKLPKLKNDAPRAIDLDLLFYGSISYQSQRLMIPHPRWQSRLFVLKPLADLTDDFDILNKLRSFPNLNQEEVVCLSN